MITGETGKYWANTMSVFKLQIQLKYGKGTVSVVVKQLIPGTARHGGHHGEGFTFNR